MRLSSFVVADIAICGDGDMAAGIAGAQRGE